MAIAAPRITKNPLTRTALLAVVAAVATIALKSAAYFVTGSVSLLSDAVESTAQTFGEILRQHQGRIRAYLRRFVVEADLADDLAQETFLAAYRSLPRRNPAAPIDLWLLSIARHRALKHLLTKKPEHDHVALETPFRGRVLVHAEGGRRFAFRRRFFAAAAAEQRGGQRDARGARAAPTRTRARLFVDSHGTVQRFAGGW